MPIPRPMLSSTNSTRKTTRTVFGLLASRRFGGFFRPAMGEPRKRQVDSTGSGRQAGGRSSPDHPYLQSKKPAHLVKPFARAGLADEVEKASGRGCAGYLGLA